MLNRNALGCTANDLWDHANNDNNSKNVVERASGSGAREQNTVGKQWFVDVRLRADSEWEMCPIGL